MLWLAVLLFATGCTIGWFWLHERLHEDAFAQKLRETQITNDAFAEHTEQVFRNVDLALSAVRDVYLRTQSIPETEHFINSLLINKALIQNVYLIDASGRITVSHNPAYRNVDVRDRDYFRFHRESTRDDLFIGSVEPGRVTGEHLFRVTRRIDNADRTFGEVVLVALRPRAFSDYYRRLNRDDEGLTSLVGLDDRKIRAQRAAWTASSGNSSIDAWGICPCSSSAPFLIATLIRSSLGKYVP